MGMNLLDKPQMPSVYNWEEKIWKQGGGKEEIIFIV